MTAGQDTAGPGLFFARLALKTRARGLILHRTCVQSCSWRLGGGFVFGGRWRRGGSAPVQRSRSCCWCCSSSSQVFPLPHRKEGSFSPCLPGQGVNHPTLVESWEGKLGAAWLKACPAFVTCLGVRARPPLEAIRQPSRLIGALPLGPRPAGP